MQTEVINGIAGLWKIEAEWRQLYDTCPHATVFQSPDWLIPWAEHFAASSTRIFVAREGASLIGLACCFVCITNGSRRELRLAGTPISDYLDVLCLQDAHEPFLTELLCFADESPCEWESYFFEQLPSASILKRKSATNSEPCLVMSLPREQGVWRDRLPKQIRQNLTYYTNRAAKLGKLTHRISDHTTLSRDLADFFALHASRWQTVNQSGVLADETIRAFHEDATLGLLRSNALRLHLLELNGKTIAAAYCVRDRQRTALYLTGYDPEYRQLSPGTLLIGHAIEQAVRDGSAEFDFLRGPEAYKHLWGAAERPTYQVSGICSNVQSETRNNKRASTAKLDQHSSWEASQSR